MNRPWPSTVWAGTAASTDGSNGGDGGSGAETVEELVDLIAAAPPAAGRGRAEPGLGRRRAAAGLDGHDVVLRRGSRAVGAVAHAAHRGAGQQTLGEAEAGRQLVVVAGRAHRGRHDHAVELDRHRLLDDELVRASCRGSVGADAGDDEPLDPLAAPPGHANGGGRVRSLAGPSCRTWPSGRHTVTMRSGVSFSSHSPSWNAW